MEIATKQMLEEFKQDLMNEISQLGETIKEPKRLFKNGSLMEYLGCSYSTIENLRNAGILPYKKVLGTYYYTYEEVSKVFEQEGIRKV